MARLEKQKGKRTTSELVEQIQWGKIHTEGLYTWQWKNNWNSNRVLGLCWKPEDFSKSAALKKQTARQSLLNLLLNFNKQTLL